MTNDEISYWERVRGVCCQAWGIPPWKFDEARRDGRITIDHVKTALDVMIITVPNPEILEEYLKPGSMEARKQQAELEKMVRSWDNVAEFIS